MEMMRVVIHLSGARFCSSTLNFGEVMFYVLRQLTFFLSILLSRFSPNGPLPYRKRQALWKPYLQFIKGKNLGHTSQARKVWQ